MLSHINDPALKIYQKWKSLQSLQSSELYTGNAGVYFSKPVNRTIVGLEVLAKIINPDDFKDIKVPTNSFTKYDYH